MPFPCPSCSGYQVFGKHGHCDLLPLPFLALGFLGIQPAQLLRHLLTVQNPKKSWLATKPACSLVDHASMGLWLPSSSPGCPRMPVSGRRWASRQLASATYSSVLWAGLAVSYFRAFPGVAIPGSGLLSQVSSLRLPLGHSGPVLTLSNAASTSLPSLLLLVADAGVCAAALLGVTFGHVICGFKLFIYFSFQLCCPLRFQGSPQTRQWECFLVFGNLSFLRLPSWDGSPSLPLLSVFLSFIFFPTSFQRQRAAFLGAWCPLLAFRSCFVEFTQCLNVLLMNLCGRKWSPRPIPLPS